MKRRSIISPRGIALGAFALASLFVSHAAASDLQTTFNQCLAGATPSTQNARPVGNAQAVFGSEVLDTDPTGDQVILDFVDSVSDDEARAFASTFGLNVRLNSSYSDDANIYIADVPEGLVPAIRDCLTGNGLLENVEENVEYQMLGAPNDPLYQFQWNFKQINAEGAWSVSTGKDVVVAVIDTGVAAEDAPDRNIKAAKDLAGTGMVGGYDFVDDDAFAWDGHGHGTHVAGTIAQTTDNKYGVAGLAHGAKIMPLRVLNSRGFGQVADIADSIRFAADNGAQVINMSLGGPLPSLVMKSAIDYAHKKGVTVVAAAGNGGKRSPSYPAAYNHVISVAATQFDRNTTFYSQWGDYVDIAAPGGNTRVDQDKDGRPDGVMQETLKDGNTAVHDFALYMGTSMASPHVAAAAALVIAQGVTNPDKVEEVLKGSANTDQKKKYSPKEYSERYGAGLLQADAAVKAAVVDQGSTRLGAGLLLGLLAFFGFGRRSSMAGSKSLYATGIVFGASGLFFLPLIFGDMGMLGTAATWLARPIAELDQLILGWHQTPIFASVLIPVGAVAFFYGHKSLRFLAAGLAIGFAGFLMAESMLMTSDVLWIPGINVLDRLWLGVNGILAFGLGVLASRE
jgi:serine protease